MLGVFSRAQRDWDRPQKKGASKKITGWRKEIRQKDTTEKLINDNVKGANPSVNLVMERGWNR